jgi:hypothetical protein
VPQPSPFLFRSEHRLEFAALAGPRESVPWGRKSQARSESAIIVFHRLKLCVGAGHERKKSGRTPARDWNADARRVGGTAAVAR